MSQSRLCLLSKDLLEARLSQIDLLRAMYPSEDEMVVEASVIESMEQLRAWCMESDGATGQTDKDASQSEQEQGLSAIPEMLSFVLNLEINSDIAMESYQTGVSIDMPVRVKARLDKDDITSDLPPFKIRLRQPSWMSKSQAGEINRALLQNRGGEDDIFGTIDHVRELVEKYLGHYKTTTQSLGKSGTDNQVSIAPNLTHSRFARQLTRVWFYFPSLSTRSKRDDLVITAPHYELTGFVLAGKPGILCLEGHSENIDDYMTYIKTESWGDIPSHQKKVSERHREVMEKKVFEDMQEITEKEWMSGRRGERGNRNDLKALEVWLRGLGLVDAFEKVFM